MDRVSAKEIPGQYLLIQIDQIFTLEQCKTLINTADAIGYQDVDRGNAVYNRIIAKVKLDGKSLHEYLLEKLRPFIPESVDGKRVTGLNDHFRFSKYYKGQFFDIHKDGINQDTDGNRSALTLNIFLNDDFEGGETEFYNSNDVNDLRYSVKPVAGRGALFFAQQYHAGNKIISGEKYLIRTDVMVSDF